MPLEATRNVKRRLAHPLVAAALLLLGGCGDGREASETGESGKLTVATSFSPTRFFAEQIGGTAVKVISPLPDDADPAKWDPNPAAVQRFQEADLIVLNGAGYEGWVSKVTLPRQRLVRTAAALEEDLIRYENAVTHAHGPKGEHTHKGVDGHTWLAPTNAKKQAKAIRDALIERRPELEETFRVNFDSLAKELDKLDKKLRSLSDVRLVASHPAYNYLAREYGWQLRNADIPPDTPPDEATAKLQKITADFPAAGILWESPPDEKLRRAIEEEVGLPSCVFSPGERLDGGDWLTVMQENIQNLRSVVAPED